MERRRRRRLGRDKMGRLNNLEGGRRNDNEREDNEIWNWLVNEWYKSNGKGALISFRELGCRIRREQFLG